MKKIYLLSALLLSSCATTQTAVPPDYTSCENNKDLTFAVDTENGEAHGAYQFTGVLNHAAVGDEGGNIADGLFLQVQDDSSPAYDYFSGMVMEGNTVNGTKNEALNFKLGVIENETLKSAASVDSATETALMDALKTGAPVTLNLVSRIEPGKGASSEFSFACSVSLAE